MDEILSKLKFLGTGMEDALECFMDDKEMYLTVLLPQPMIMRIL